MENEERLSLLKLPLITSESVQGFVHEWHNSIQFSPTRSSDSPASQLVDEVASIFLKESAEHTRERRDRRAASKLAKDALTAAVSQHQLGAVYKVVRQEEVVGKHLSHKFDVGLLNHALRIGVNGLSFELKTDEQIESDAKDAMFKILDTRLANNDVGLAIAAVGVTTETPLLDEVKAFCVEVNADFVVEEEMDNWAEQKVLALA